MAARTHIGHCGTCDMFFRMTFAIYVQKSQVHNVCDMVVVYLQMRIFIDFFIINEKIEKNI
jgi:hypothetical protein